MLRRKKKSTKHESALEEMIDVPVDAVKKEWKLLKYVWIKDEDHLLFASFIIVLLGAIVIATVLVSNRQTHIIYRDVGAYTNVEQVLTSTQEAKNGAFTVSISSVTESDKKDPAFALASDETLLVMDITIKNTSRKNQSLIPVSQFYVRDNEGGYYTLRPSVYVTTPLAGADVEPNKTVSGKLSFAVPKRASAPLLYVDLGWDNYVPVVFSPLQ